MFKATEVERKTSEINLKKYIVYACAKVLEGKKLWRQKIYGRNHIVYILRKKYKLARRVGGRKAIGTQ